MLKRVLALVAAVWAMAVTPVAAQDAPKETWIQAGKLLAVPGEGYQSNKTVVVRDGRIVEVRDGFATPRKAGIEVIDMRKGYVLPGLIDSHVHLLSEWSPMVRFSQFTQSESFTAFSGANNAKKTLMAGFTTVQDVGGSAEAIFALRDAVAAGYVPGPRIRASGPAVTPTGGHGDFNGFAPRVTAVFEGNTCNGADDCRRATREAIKAGADVIKITATGGVLSNTRAGLGQQLMDDELRAIVEAAESMGRYVTAHAHGKDGIEAALRAGVKSIEHGTYLDDETIALFREKGATLVPTVLAGVTVTGWVDEPWLPAPSREKAAQVGPLMVDMLRRAKEGGVNVAFGTDTGVSPHGENAQEFALMVQAGFTPEEAIRAATVIAAIHLELGDEIGTIEVGKAADIIAVMGDPLKDVTELEDVDFVMKGGVVYKNEN